MKQLSFLLWKEWRESQAYLWIGLGVFLGLPLIGGLEDVFTSSRHLHVEAVPWVAAFGGVLAIFTAVGATCRDLSGRVEEFWRAVPVTVSRWLSIKFIVGAMIVLLACAAPILVQAELARDGDLLTRLGTFSLLVFAVYGLAFAAGCLLRRTAHAAMVGLSLMLLIWFLPMILPPLAFLNVLDFDELTKELTGGACVDFIAAMLVLAGLSAGLAIIAVRRSWRIESGRKLIYGAIAAVVLILAASASFDLGTNLPLLQTVDIPGVDFLQEIRVDGTSGAVVTGHDIIDNKTGIDTTTWRVTKFTIGPHGIQLGATGTPKQFRPLWARRIKDLIDTKGVEYGVGTDNDSHVGPLRLLAVQTKPDGSELPERTLDVKLWNLDERGNISADTYIWKDRLYVLGLDRPQGPARANRLAILDITEPFKPRVLSINPMDYRFTDLPLPSNWSSGAETLPDQMTVALPDIPGLPVQKRLAIALSRSWYLRAGDTFIYRPNHGALAAYRVNMPSDREAKFVRVGVYKPSALERFFRGDFLWYRNTDESTNNGFLYLREDFGGSVLQPCICVFDLRGEHPMKLVAHFAAPDASVVYPLDDGRALVGGNKLWLVGPPPRR